MHQIVRFAHWGAQPASRLVRPLCRTLDAMRGCPRISKLVRNDTGSFICVAGPAVFSLIILGLIILFDYPFESYSITDVYILVIGISVAAVVLWPFVAWWYLVI